MFDDVLEVRHFMMYRRRRSDDDSDDCCSDCDQLLMSSLTSVVDDADYQPYLLVSSVCREIGRLCLRTTLGPIGYTFLPVK